MNLARGVEPGGTADSPPIREARGPELRPLAEVLARAFRDNPLNLAVVGGRPERRVRSNLHGMRTTLDAAHGRVPIWLVPDAPAGQAPAGGLVAMPPFSWPLPPPSLGTQLRTLLGQGLGAARRWGRVFEALEVHHPSAPHWYLAVVGVAPDRQGRGYGTRLIEHFLARVDADHLPAYLETDRRENVGLYERAGFRVEAETRVLGVTVWRMWRAAQP